MTALILHLVRNVGYCELRRENIISASTVSGELKFASETSRRLGSKLADAPTCGPAVARTRQADERQEHSQRVSTCMKNT